LRFSNHDLRENLEGVIEGIHRMLEDLRERG
jgi:very-short-patch-repair endonuclease